MAEVKGASGTVVGVVGAGIVGLAVARELQRRSPGTQVLVLEKEDRVGMHQTGHNSGVVHAGLYYRPGSLKAGLCTRGRAMLREYCADKGVPYVERGKLVVAVDDAELSRFEALERTARENGVPGLRRLDRQQIREVEPHVAGIAALHSPHTAVTDFGAVAAALAADVETGGGRILLGAEVTGIERREGRIDVAAGHDRFAVDRLVLCAGAQSDRLALRTGGDRSPAIVPFRGEYLTVREDAGRELVRGLVYPVPDPRYPFLGVHLTRGIDGTLQLGPNALLALHRESESRLAVRPADVAAVVRWPGTWRMAARHWRTGLAELRDSAWIGAAVGAAQRYVPELRRTDVERGRTGVRAQAVARDGTLVDDFVVEESDGVTSLRNAPSPAATSSLAIAEHVVDRVLERL